MHIMMLMDAMLLACRSTVAANAWSRLARCSSGKRAGVDRVAGLWRRRKQEVTLLHAASRKELCQRAQRLKRPCQQRPAVSPASSCDRWLDFKICCAAANNHFLFATSCQLAGAGGHQPKSEQLPQCSRCESMDQ